MEEKSRDQTQGLKFINKIRAWDFSIEESVIICTAFIFILIGIIVIIQGIYLIFRGETADFGGRILLGLGTIGFGLISFVIVKEEP